MIRLSASRSVAGRGRIFGVLTLVLALAAVLARSGGGQEASVPQLEAGGESELGTPPPEEPSAEVEGDEVRADEDDASPGLPGGRSEAAESAAGGAAPSGEEEGRGGSGGRLLKKGLGALSSLLGGGEEAGALAGGGSGGEENQGKIVELERLARSNFEKNRVGEAIKNINELIALKPYEADYHFALGLCYRQEAKYTEALKKYQDVLDLGGPKALIALLKAEVFAAQNKRDKVLEMLREAATAGRNIINDVHKLPLLGGFESDTEFINLALQLERFELSREPVDDPFTNPFPELIKGGEAEEASRPGRDRPVSLTKAQQENLLREARKLYEHIQFYIKLQDEDKAMASYLQLKELITKKKMLTVPKIRNEFELVVERMDDIEIEISGIRLRYYYNKAQEQLQRMQEVFRDGDYARVAVIHGELEALAREMVGTNERYRQVADEILERSRYWVERASVRLEFQAHQPAIQGIIIAGDAKMTILNDRIVKQGESLDDFRVVGVESNKVTFRFKGEEIPVVFRRY